MPMDVNRSKQGSKSQTATSRCLTNLLFRNKLPRTKRKEAAMNREATEADEDQIAITSAPALDEGLRNPVVGDDRDQLIKEEVRVEKDPINTGTNNGSITGEFNTEAAITADDVMRAGGFGARDDIGSFLPVAIDSTDFEASLRDARGFEEPQGETSRPGLGWSEPMNKD